MTEYYINNECNLDHAVVMRDSMTDFVVVVLGRAAWPGW